MALADIHDPARLATAIHRQLRPILSALDPRAIALELDIGEVRIETLDGCEGVLLTDRVRSVGSILVNDQHGSRRARFSIAHELGHFLLERHRLTSGDGFRCRVADMRQSRTKEIVDRQETEANTFAISLLVPTDLARGILAQDPSIESVRSLMHLCDISKEAAARYLVEQHDAPLAAVFCKDGTIRYTIRNDRFPWVNRGRGGMVSTLSATAGALAVGKTGQASWREVTPAVWTAADLPALFETVWIGKDGHSLSLLWADLPEAEE